jgi:hypothetical protein
MKKSINISFAVLFALTVSTIVNGQIIYETPSKKLIEFSHKSPTTIQYVNNIEFYEDIPFDGITVKLPADVGGGNIFMVDDWEKVDEIKKLEQKEVIELIGNKSSLQHNFLVIYGASQMDWFSDEQWKAVEENLRYCVKLAKLGNFKGILWDPEPYKPGKNPWKYHHLPLNDKYSFEEYYHQIQKRGSQFIQIIQEEYPGLIILSLRELSDYQSASPFSQFILPVVDPLSAIEKLEYGYWGLHLPFTLGIINKINEDVTFIDANEEAYYYTSAIEYYKFRDIIFNDALTLVPEKLRKKYKSKYSIGHAISTDYIAANWVGLNSFPYKLSAQAEMLTPEQRAQWFEHNVYYALSTTDEYAWLYTEGPNWWTGDKIPSGFEDALVRAREKVNNSQPLGFSIEEMLLKAQAEAEKKYKNKQ